MNFNFVRYFRWAVLLSIILTTYSVFIFLYKGLNYSVDFTGGIVMELTANNQINRDILEQKLKPFVKNLSEIKKVQNHYITDRELFLVRVGGAENNVKNLSRMVLDSLKEYNPTIESMQYIGPKLGSELLHRSYFAIIVALLGIMIYTWLRFKMEFAIGVLISLVHDAVVTVGFCSTFGYEFDSASIAALLTVIGYSINDSVVIYDRIRENSKSNVPLSDVINSSINQTLSRTTMTVASTIIVCVVLLLFGDEKLRSFSYITTFGIAFGTYSSIFISAPIVLLFSPKLKL
ncbi:protein translocase subunit SecF [Candidatus Fokinia crypta]|uniref:Protein-export membrane protein SecF n=1 Tax=Candidatus Fokinia crypta TaxID=1920990 RepID=A0ABZ0USB6_9RICK|nr:protein translocase subunit SecF [Candidatus Fokinia cryptica]WPX98043.1 Protein-export membrane protein SecF [Candidatus Fokinia cryptica]